MRTIISFNFCVALTVVYFLLQTTTVIEGSRLPTPWSKRYGSAQFISTKDELSDAPSNIVAAENDDSDSNDEEDNNNDSEDNDTEGSREGGRGEERKSKNSAEIQFMITNKMRNTLIQDLGYLASEVDNMEPQIAAVVIERSLRRPRKGMPASWRRNANNDQGGENFLSSWKDGLFGFLRSSVDFTNNSLRPILPILIVSSILYFQRDSILFITNSLFNSVKSKNFELFRSKERKSYISDEDDEQDTRSRQRNTGQRTNSNKSKGGFWGSSQNKNRRISDESEPPAAPATVKEGGNSLTSENRVDIKAYDKVVTQSWLDELFPAGNSKQFMN